MKKMRRAAARACLACLLFSACAPRAGLFPLGDRETAARALGDDLAFERMADAVKGSAEYYRRVPGAFFRYGETVYSAAEMEASMGLFLEILDRFEGEAREKAIRERFLFFESRNDEGAAFFTGYYEPLLEGSRERDGRFTVPLYAVPPDLLTLRLDPFVALGLLPRDLENKVLKGKVKGREIVPYDGREQISYGDSLRGRAEVLAYLDDEVDLSFLQIQGSGQVRLEDGSVLRLNYADQNGHPYRAIGRVLLDRIPRERMSLQSIREYLRANPGEVRDVLSSNPSYTFFRVVDRGPLGNIEVPLTPGRSVAMDSRMIPRGGLVYFQTSFPAGSLPRGAGPLAFGRFGVVQDTGGAIRGNGRVDIFWGSGPEAEKIAGHMKEKGRVWLLVARKEYLRGGAPLSEDHRQ